MITRIITRLSRFVRISICRDPDVILKKFLHSGHRFLQIFCDLAPACRRQRFLRFGGNKAVTLQELVFAVVVLIIIGLVAVIKLVNVPSKVLNTQEEALINSLKKALIVYNATYDRWYAADDDGDGMPNPGENPFQLLQDPPPYAEGSGGDGLGKTWYLGWNGSDVWFIYCPHCNWINCSTEKGRTWSYYVSGANAGKISKGINKGH